MTTQLAVSREQEIIKELSSLHSEFQRASRKAVGAGVRIGELLTEVKAGLTHGNFLPWIEQHCEFSQVMATQYMRAYEGSKLKVTSSLGSITLTELAALAPSQRESAPKQESKTEPVAPSRPKCPGVEGTKGGEYSWDEKDKKWYKHTGRQPEIPWIGAPSTPAGMTERGARDYMISVFTEIVINNPGDAYKMLASKYHPDRNKSPEAAKIMSQLNLAKEALK